MHDSYTNSQRPCQFRTPKGAQPIQCTSRAALHRQNYKPTKIIISLLVTIHRFVQKQTSTSFSVSLTSVICVIYSLYYVFNFRNGLVQPLTPNFKSCLTFTCILTHHYNMCDKFVLCSSPHSKTTHDFICGIKSPPPPTPAHIPIWLTVLIVD